MEELRAHMCKLDIEWYLLVALGTQGSDAARASAMLKMERARKLDLKQELEIDAWLRDAESRPAPVRLEMMDAEGTPIAGSPAQSPAPYTNTKTPSSVNTMFTLKQISLMVYAAITSASSATFTKGLTTPADKAGQKAIEKLTTIYSPKTPAAETTATRNYDDVLRGLTSSSPLPEFYNQLSAAAGICNYYNPTAITTARMVVDIVRAVTVAWGESSLITAQMAKFDPEHTKYKPDAERRAIDLLAL